MINEFFPPTEDELEQMISTLKQQLEDPKFEEDWKTLYLELEERQNQLKNLIILNYTI